MLSLKVAQPVGKHSQLKQLWNENLVTVREDRTGKQTQTLAP